MLYARCKTIDSCIFFFFKDFIYLFLERGREGGKEGEKHQCVVASRAPLGLQLGTCPATQACALDWGSNWRPFGLQASTQSTEPHQSGLIAIFSKQYMKDWRLGHPVTKKFVHWGQYHSTHCGQTGNTKQYKQGSFLKRP